MEKDIEPMDILMVPTKEMKILAKIGKWIKSSYYDQNRYVNIVFKKETPQSILKLFQENTYVFHQKVNKNYQIAE